MTLVTGKCLELSGEGSGDRITIGNQAVYNLTSAMWIECWLYLIAEANASRWPGIVDKNDAYSLRVNQSSKDIYGRFKVGAATVTTAFYTLPSLTTWYHCNLLFEYPGNRTIWVNGSEVIAPAANSGNLDTNVNDLQVGRVSTADNYCINARMDEIRLYNRMPAAGEIAYNYNSGDGRATPYDRTGLILWLPLLIGEGAVAYDKSTQGNDGTIVNPEWVAGKVQHTGTVWDYFTWG